MRQGIVFARNLFAGISLLFLCQCSSVMLRPTPSKSLEIPGRPHWAADDGKRLPFSQWPGADESLPEKPESIFICVHGLSGAADDFVTLGEHFEKRGFVVYAMEVRGQGNDPDKAAHGDIRSSELWIDDLYAFTRMIKRRHPGIPVFWFGESMGALISIHALARAADMASDVLPISGLILTSPVTSIRHKIPVWKEVPLRLVMRIAPGFRVSLESLGSREVREQNVTSTTTHREQMEKTPHYVETFTFRLFRELESLIDSSHTAGAQLNDPVLLFYTPNDVFTSKEGVEAFFEDVSTDDKSKVFYPDSFHLILHDKDRGKVLQEVEDWVRVRSER